VLARYPGATIVRTETKAALERLDFRPAAAQALARAGDVAARPYLVDGLALPTLRVPSAVLTWAW